MTSLRALPVLELTQRFMQCATCFEGESAPSELSPLWPPRGWAGPRTIRSPTLMLVSLNPGHPLQLAAHYGAGWDELALLNHHGLVASATLETGQIVARR